MTGDNRNKPKLSSRSGRQLYQLLPAVYRNRDGSEDGEGHDLAAYLDSFGVVLDGLRALLDQQLADNFPDDPATLGRGGQPAQDWVLPYLGALVDARPVSIDPDRQRAEIASAVRWRQRKGTLEAAEELTEAVADVSAVLQEGWQRVAVTARIDGRSNRAVTVDTRRRAHAEISDEARGGMERGTNYTRFEGIERLWRVVEADGLPRHRDSYQDISLRTVDTRSPSDDRRRGLYHPRRLLAWVAPAQTLLPLPRRTLSWQEFIGRDDGEGSKDGLRLRTGDAREFVCGYPGEVVIDDPLIVLDGGRHDLEGLHFAGRVRVDGGQLQARRCHFAALELATPGEPALGAQDCYFAAIEGYGALSLEACTVRGPLHQRSLAARDCIFTAALAPALAGDLDNCWHPQAGGAVHFLAADPTATAAAVLHPASAAWVLVDDEGRELGRYRYGRPHPVRLAGEVLVSLDPGAGHEDYELADLVLDGRLALGAGSLRLRRVVAREVEIGRDATRLIARACLFASLGAEAGTDPARTRLELESCTVMHHGGGARLHASDCILVDADPAAEAQAGCLRWSSLPRSWSLSGRERCVHATAHFIPADFGQRLYGLLSPASPPAIRSGAEDGGELGAYHDSHWLQRLAGVEEKLRDHVPIGVTPVLIPDTRLVDAPPDPVPNESPHDE